MNFALIVSVLVSSQLYSTLSGGEKLQIQLIRELACPHDIIFLDEPSNDMDLTTTTIKLIKTLMKRLSTFHMTILYQADSRYYYPSELLKRRRQARTRHLIRRTIANNVPEAPDAKVKTEKKPMTAMAKHRRIKQNVQTTLRNTHDSTQGRRLPKR